VFATSGRLHAPGFIPSQFACAGSVRVSFWLGRHRVARSIVPVQANCGFASVTAFKHRPRHRHGRVKLRVFARFLGTGYLAPKTGRAGKVRLG
jgi:hypothetical protein